MHLDIFIRFGTQYERSTSMCERKTEQAYVDTGERTFPKTLTIKEVQDILQIGTNNAYTLIHRKVFPVIRIGRSYRIPAEPFFAWLKESHSVDC